MVFEKIVLVAILMVNCCFLPLTAHSAEQHKQVQQFGHTRQVGIKEPKVMMVANANRRKRNARTTSQLEDLTVDDFKHLMGKFEEQRVALQRRAQMEAQREVLQTV